MKIKEVTVSKALKVNLGNYSSMDTSVGFTVEIDDKEQPDWDGIFDTLNRQLMIEKDNHEARWIKKADEPEQWKLTFTTKKRKGGE